MPRTQKFFNSILKNWSLEKLGCRIMVIGPMASGKSTTSELLGKRLNLPVYHLDQLYFLPNTSWQGRSDEEFEKIHESIVQSDRWIIDGNFVEVFKSRVNRATSIVFANPHFLRCICNFYKRFFRKNRNLLAYPGRPHEIHEKFTIKSLKYIFRFKKNISKFLSELKNFPMENIFYIKSFREMKHFQELIKNS